MQPQKIWNDIAKLERVCVALGRRRADEAALERQVHEGLLHPIGFPGLGEFLFSGDRVVIAVHGGIPQVELVLNPVLHEFVSAGGVEQITLLFADRESESRFRQHGADSLRRLETTVHEGTADGAMALLGADDDNQPILVNRFVFDADVLIPIVRAGGDIFGSSRPLMWDFFDSATKRRWRNRAMQRDDDYGSRLCDLVGVLVVVQVIVGPGDFAYDIVVGQVGATQATVKTCQSEAWHVQRPEQVDIVVATIEDHRDRKSWQAVRDAIVASASLGANLPIVIVCDIDEIPPHTIKSILSGVKAGADTADPPLAAAMRKRLVYLCSGLEADVVHELGLKSISDSEEVRTLLARFENPVLLRDVQRAADDFDSPLPRADRAKPAKAARAKKRTTRSRRAND